MDFERFFDAERGALNLGNHDLRTLSEDIVEHFSDITKQLDLSHNRLADLSWIYKFTELKVFILDDNPLSESHLKRLTEPLSQIEVLMLNKNEFSDLHSTIEELSRIFPSLQHLSLHGNAICPDGLALRPFSEYINYDYNYYRTEIVKAFPKLKFLDHASINILDVETIQHKKNSSFFCGTSNELGRKLSGFFKYLSRTHEYRKSNFPSRCHSLRRTQCSTNDCGEALNNEGL